MLVGPVAPARAQEPENGLDLEVAAHYTMRPARRLVDVSLEAVATNTLVDTEGDFGITRFYFDELVFAIPVEAVAVTARDETGELAVAVVERRPDGISEAAVQLRSRLYSGQSRGVTLEFELPAAPPRSPGDIRIDRANGWFFLWAYGDPGKSTVSASIPESFDVDVIGDALRWSSSETGERLLVSGVIEDPLAWVAVISARNDSELVSTEFQLGGTTMELRSWPSDPEWPAGVEEILRAGVPVLGDLVGRSWTTDMVITEAMEPSIHTSAGWNDDSVHSIELDEGLDAHLVLHEISHVWFNVGLFTDRWMTEGLADAFADAAVAEIGGARRTPEQVDRAGPGAIPLNDWVDPAAGPGPPDAVETYGRAASWMVVDRIVDEIGVELMRAVLEAAWNDVIAYQGDARLDLVAAGDDWRRFLDLLEEVGGSTEANGLFETWVVSPAQQALLDERSAARARYAEVEHAAGDWALPPGLRRSMGEWRFSDASLALAAASRVIAERDRLAMVADRAGVQPRSLEAQFEAGEQADVLVAQLEAQEAVASNIADADRDAEAVRTVFQSIGLLGSRVDGALEDARQAYSEGELAEARELAVAVSERIDAAESTGRVRSGISIGVVVGGVVAGAGLGRRRRTVNSDS